MDYTKLPIEYLPKCYFSQLEFYDLLDNVLCFLQKNNIQSTITNVTKLYNSMVNATQLGTDNNWNNFENIPFRNGLIQGFDLYLIDNSNSNEIFILRSEKYSGIGKKHILLRKKEILKGMWSNVIEYFENKQGIVFSRSDFNSIKKNGWPDNFNIEDFLPSYNLSKLSENIALHDNFVNLSSQSLTTSSNQLSNSAFNSFVNDSKYHDILQDLMKSSFYADQIQYIHQIPSRIAKFMDLNKPLPSTLSEILSRHLKIEKLFQHQVLAIDAIRNEKNVVISTNTSSGKSFIYNLPVFESILEDPLTTSIYLFPTKALAQDQMKGINSFFGNSMIFGINPVTCDGDSSLGDRILIKNGHGNIILTNPDMLHHTLLPNHNQWKRIFTNLKYVIIDEAHAYSGAFGTHVALVLRRLARICFFYGKLPQFICCSATIANPKEFVKQLIPLEWLQLVSSKLKKSENTGDLNLVVIDSSLDGSPQGERTIVFWNSNSSPPINKTSKPSIPANTCYDSIAPLNCYDKQYVDFKPDFQPLENFNEEKPEENLQTFSTIYETALLFSKILTYKLRTIAFCKTRKLVELVYKYSRQILSQWNREDLLKSISSYRGGYTKEERRQIESLLFNNDLLGVMTTSALELGIDVGSLDVSLIMGFPGSYSSLWQQIGRSGRSERPGLAIIVCFNSPLDQYFVKNPQILLETSCEASIIDIENPLILKGHLLLASKEIPLNFSFDLFSSENPEQSMWGNSYVSLLSSLYESNSLVLQNPIFNDKSILDCELVSKLTSEDLNINLRMIDPITISIKELETNEIIDRIEYTRAFFELFEGAIFLHRGKQYLIHKLDLKSLVATAKRNHDNYFTSALNNSMIYLIKVIKFDSHNLFNYGIIQVVHIVKGFIKKKFGSGKPFDEGKCSLPPLEYETQGLWVDLPIELKSLLEIQNIIPHHAIHSTNHVLATICPLRSQCDPTDLASEHDISSEAHIHPFRLMLYDKRPGGLGTCCSLFDQRKELLQLALNLVKSCGCIEGCPCCIFDGRCTGYNDCLSKQGAIVILEYLNNKLTEKPSDRNHLVQPIIQDYSKENEPSPRKRFREKQINSNYRESVRSKGLSLKNNWAKFIPDFVPDFESKKEL